MWVGADGQYCDNVEETTGNTKEKAKVYRVTNIRFGFRSHIGNTQGSMPTFHPATRTPPFLATCCRMLLVALVSHGYVMIHQNAYQ